jgi:hypothetical protein
MARLSEEFARAETRNHKSALRPGQLFKSHPIRTCGLAIGPEIARRVTRWIIIGNDLAELEDCLA